MKTNQKRRNQKSDRLTMKERALKYAARGWSVLPIHSVRHDKCTCGENSCTRPGKHPRTKHGIHDATIDSETIGTWWDKLPQTNVGIATGKASGILVIDIDPRNDGEKTLKELEKELGGLPETVTARSGGGGRHLYFKYPAFAVPKDSSGKLLGRGLDVISDGGYVVAPRSKHVSGKNYIWPEGQGYTVRKVAQLSDTWLDRLRAGNKVSTESQNVPDERPTVSEGSRNNHLTSVAGRLWNLGIAREALLAGLQAENQNICRPPLDDTEVEKIATSVTTYPAKRSEPGDDVVENIMENLLNQHFAGGKVLMYCLDGQFWRFDDRKWVPVNDRWLEGRILETIRRMRNV